MDVVVTQAQVFVKLPTGKTIQAELDSTNLCSALKEKITEDLLENEQPPLASHQQILSFSGTVLHDAKPLSDFNIQQDSTIYLSIKPPPKDLLHFDECHACICSAIEPLVLPCGHSCCKGCIDDDATICPVEGCKSPMNGRETLPKNWIADQFFDPKPEKETRTCQICAENEIQKEATRWCQSCSFTSDVEYFCDACDDAEHSARTNRGHIRMPVEKTSLTLSFSLCPKHKISEDSFCFDCSIFLCHMCRDGSHRIHSTKLAVDYEKQIKSELASSVFILADLEPFEKEENELNDSKQVKQLEQKSLEDRIEQIKLEIETINSKVHENHVNAEKAVAASSVLMKAIQNYPRGDLFDQQKLRVLTSRISQTFDLLADYRNPLLMAHSHFFGSAILRKAKLSVLRALESLFPEMTGAKLLYSAVEHGWTAERFHDFCDQKYNTVVLIEVGTFIFGGFTPYRWNEVANNYAPKHDNSFLFSLSNPSNTCIGVKFPNDGPHHSNRSICCHPSYGATFGGGCDIYICDQAHLFASCHTRLGNSYSHPTLKYATKEIETFFCGSENFTPTNIEVFQLTLDPAPPVVRAGYSQL